MDASALRAPTPPFPYGAWLVVAGDAQGSFLEILPATAVFELEAPLGLRLRPVKSEPVAAHVLVSAAVSGEMIHTIAQREGWRVQEVETGLFKIVKLWIDGNVLVELLTKKEAGRYIETFGAAGLSILDGKLRELEVKLGSVLS